jgi:hypothetical protein
MAVISVICFFFINLRFIAAEFTSHKRQNDNEYNIPGVHKYQAPSRPVDPISFYGGALYFWALNILSVTFMAYRIVENLSNFW